MLPTKITHISIYQNVLNVNLKLNNTYKQSDGCILQKFTKIYKKLFFSSEFIFINEFCSDASLIDGGFDIDGGTTDGATDITCADGKAPDSAGENCGQLDTEVYYMY